MADNLRGALWIVVSSLFATGMTVGVRALAPEIQSMQTAFGRSAVGLAIVVPWLISQAWRRGNPFATGHLKLHVLRGLLGVAAINCGFYSLTKLPLATATILFFTTPLFVTLLAPLFLGERIGWRRWSATLAGFAGTLIVIRPAPGSFDPNMLFAIASSLFFAIILLVGKRISMAESPLNMMFYGSLLMTILCLPPAIPVWKAPDPAEMLLLAMVGAFGTIRTYCDIKGFAVGEASAVAPFQYARLLFVAVAGYVMFDEVLDGPDIIGAAVILASTLYIARREARLRKVRVPIEA